MFLYLDYKAMPVQAYKGMGQDGALSPQQHAKKNGSRSSRFNSQRTTI
jgi:hypothetical protein